MVDSIELHTHVDALFTSDEHGDMTVINDWRKQGRAPDFYLGLTRSGMILKYHADLPRSLRHKLAEFASQESAASWSSLQRPHFCQTYEDLLATSAPDKDLRVWFGPAYYFAEPVTEPLAANIIKVGPENQFMLNPYLADWLPDVAHEQPMMAWVEQGEALGVCASVRCTETAMAAGVEVTPHARRRGIGREVVKAWAQAVQQLGKIALYSTSSDNEASKHLAASLGLPLLGTDFHLSLIQGDSG